MSHYRNSVTRLHLLQEHTLKRCVSRGRIRSLRFRIPAQTDDQSSEEIQYLFTRSRSVDPEEVEMTAVAMKLELDDDAPMGHIGSEAPQAGPSSAGAQNHSDPSTFGSHYLRLGNPHFEFL